MLACTWCFLILILAEPGEPTGASSSARLQYSTLTLLHSYSMFLRVPPISWDWKTSIKQKIEGDFHSEWFLVEVLSQSANTAQNIDTLQMLWSRKYSAMQEQSFGYVGIKFDGYREELLLSVWMTKGMQLRQGNLHVWWSMVKISCPYIPIHQTRQNCFQPALFNVTKDLDRFDSEGGDGMHQQRLLIPSWLKQIGKPWHDLLHCQILIFQKAEGEAPPVMPFAGTV